jgi:hypothetical protein
MVCNYWLPGSGLCGADCGYFYTAQENFSFGIILLANLSEEIYQYTISGKYAKIFLK